MLFYIPIILGTVNYYAENIIRWERIMVDEDVRCIKRDQTAPLQRSDFFLFKDSFMEL